MLNVIFVADDLDGQIGPNCVLAHKHLTTEFDFSENKVICLTGADCTSERVQSSITSFNGGKFILAAFSHGNQEALVSHVEAGGYVNAEQG
jgi:hypothetical protein